MRITQWVLVSGVKGVINDAEKDGKVEGLVKTTNELLTAFFPGDEKVIKQLFVCKVIIPYIKLILKDIKEGYEAAKLKL